MSQAYLTGLYRVILPHLKKLGNTVSAVTRAERYFDPADARIRVEGKMQVPLAERAANQHRSGETSQQMRRDRRPRQRPAPFPAHCWENRVPFSDGRGPS